MAQYIPMTQVTVNSVDISDHVLTCTLAHANESQDITTQANTFRKFGAGLESNTIDLEIQLDQASGETTATLEALVGTRTTVVLVPQSGAVSATNRRYTVSDCYVESFAPIDGGLGSIATTSIQMTGGSLTIANS